MRADVKALHMHLRKDIVPSDQRWGFNNQEARGMIANTDQKKRSLIRVLHETQNL